MLSLPPFNHPARELFTVPHLVEITTTRRDKLPTLPQAAASAREAFAHSKAHKGGLQAVTSFVVFADGMLRLVTFGPKGGRKVRWTFGRL